MELWPLARRETLTPRRERWNIGFQKDISHFNFIVNPTSGGTINPTLHYPRTHYSTIPLFHCSIIPIVSKQPVQLKAPTIDYLLLVIDPDSYAPYR
jgi:hypothetical protein